MRQLLLASVAIAVLASPSLAQAELEAETDAETEAEVDTSAPSPESDAPIGLRSNETQVDVDGDGEPETLKNGYTDEHPWVDAAVYSAGRQVGEIERVHFLRDELDTVVIETGGAAEVGGREIEVTENDVEQIARDDGSLGFELKMAMTDFEGLPAFNERRASDFPLDNQVEGDAEDADADGDADDAAESEEDDEEAEETG
jgi:hypothetical protein